MPILQALIEASKAYGLDNLTHAWVNIVMIGTLATLLWSRWLLARLERQFRSLVKILESPEINRRSLEAVIQVDEALHQVPDGHVKDAWNRYRSAVQRALDAGSHLPDFDPYFSKTTLIDVPAHRGIVQLIPGLQIALGILGTFWGLVIGLGGIDVGQPDMRPQIQTLVASMGVAFYTSVVGIAMSVLFNFVDRTFLERCHSQLLLLHGSLAATLPVADETMLLSGLLRAQEDQTSTIKQVAMEVIIPHMNAQAMAITQGMKSVVEQSMAPMVTEVTGATRDLIRVATEGQLERIQLMADRFTENLDTIMQGRLRELADTLKSVIDWQKVVKQEVSDLIDEIRDAAVTIAPTIDALEQMQSRTAEAAAQLGQHADNLAAISAQTIEMTDRIKGLLPSLTDAMSQLHASVTSAAETKDVLAAQTRELAQVWTQMESRMAALVDGITKGSEVFKENVEVVLRRSFAQFDEAIGSAMDHLRQVAGTLAEAAPDLEKGMVGIRDAFHGLIQSVEHLETVITKHIEILVQGNQQVHATQTTDPSTAPGA